MKRSRYEQFAIVTGDTAQSFSQKLNEEIYRLRDKDPVVEFSDSNPFYARIKYAVNFEAPETIAEASEMDGVSFVCLQCPYFHPVTTEEGEIDKRFKWGECEHAEFGRTYKTTAACDKLYDLIKEGDVKLCFTN